MSRIWSGVAKDAEILAIAAMAPPGQSAPRLLITSVQYLYLRTKKSSVAGLYDYTLSEDSVSFDTFRSFCLDHQDEISRLVSSPLLPTTTSMNFNRAAQLLPAFGFVYELSGKKPLALVEIGASAGLNLLWDKYGYNYGGGMAYSRGSSVQISCELRGACVPPLPDKLPSVASRVGIDLHPVDILNDDIARWLIASLSPRSLISARSDTEARLERIREIVRRESPNVMKGDAIDLLRGVLEHAPQEAALCIYHTHTLEQFSIHKIKKLFQIATEFSQRRDVYQVSIEHLRRKPPDLELILYRKSRMRRRLLAHCAESGAWLEWICPGSPIYGWSRRVLGRSDSQLPRF
jgi:hypothetical protein